jgi:uncharacterized membrane protein
MNLGGLPGSSDSVANAINDAGQAVGLSLVGGVDCATEWSDGRVINLGGSQGTTFSEAFSINDAGQAAGESASVPEPSTWAMMLLGFAGLVLAGYRRAREQRAA